MFDHTVTNTRQAREDDRREHIPVPHDDLFKCIFSLESHCESVFFSLEDKLFDRVIDAPFRRAESFMGYFFCLRLGLLSSGVLLSESYGTLFIEL